MLNVKFIIYHTCICGYKCELCYNMKKIWKISLLCTTIVDSHTNGFIITIFRHHVHSTNDFD